jgi:hypothetical protein
LGHTVDDDEQATQVNDERAFIELLLAVSASSIVYSLLRRSE